MNAHVNYYHIIYAKYRHSYKEKQFIEQRNDFSISENKNIASWLSIGICTTPCTAIATYDTKRTPVHRTFFMGAIIIIVQWYHSY